METTNHPSLKGFASDLEHLKAKTKELKQNVSQQLTNLTTDTNQAVKIGVVLLGIAAGAWIVYKLSTRTERSVTLADGTKLVPVRSSFPLLNTIKNAIAAWLLGMARERIINFLERVNEAQNEVKGRTNTAGTE